jgi:hypothetical protein
LAGGFLLAEGVYPLFTLVKKFFEKVLPFLNNYAKLITSAKADTPSNKSNT